VRYWLHPEAEAELGEAAVYYAIAHQHREPGYWAPRV
jgi:hypothetical protein